jgi:hypothetical protein
MSDLARTTAAATRNRDPILAVLREVLPGSGTVLEIASGSGEHAVYFANSLPRLTWQPTDAADAALASITAHRARAQLPNLLPPLALDVRESVWPVTHADAIVAINMVHISPWAATEGLMAGASRVLGRDGTLFLYGPYFESDVVTAPSNIAFDADLRRRNPAWGLRDRDVVVALAAQHEFGLAGRYAMPANNISLVFRRHD